MCGSPAHHGLKLDTDEMRSIRDNLHQSRECLSSSQDTLSPEDCSMAARLTGEVTYKSTHAQFI